MSLLVILELRKATNVTILPTRSLLYLQMSRFLNPFHLFLHKVHFTSGVSFFSQSVSLSPPASVPDVFVSVTDRPWFTVAVSAADSATLRQIGLGDSDRYQAIRAKRYRESSKNSEKITTNLKKM